MQENTRSKNAVLNILLGYIALIGIKIIALISQRIFLRYLSVDYLGINGLYENIMVILALPEIGIDTAFMYLLYEPIANRNKERTASLYQWFNKRYIIVSILVFIIGLLLIPFLHLFITSSFPTKDLVNYYILSLLNLMTQYIMAPKVALLTAYQEQRYHKAIVFISTFLLRLFQIVVIKIWKNFYLYLLVTIFTNIISNILLEILCSKTHKEIYIDTNKIEINKKTIITKTKEALIYRTISTLANGIDSILISSIVTIMALGIYSNYYVIICTAQEFIAIISLSLISGVGNLLNENSLEKQYGIFNTTNLFYQLICTIGLCGFTLLTNQFITLWLGKELLFDSFTVFVISLNFYVANTMSPVVIFCEASGLFKNVKNTLLVQALISIVFSYVFGNMWGVSGIFVAKIISTLATTYWYEPKLLFKEIFNKSTCLYWKKQLKYYIISIVSFVACYLIINNIVSQTIMGFITKTLIVVGVVCLLFYLATRNTKEYRRIIELIKTGFYKQK